jgi:hypothetical protein
LCREEGQTLTKLSADEALKGFGFFGVVKETGVDDEGLFEFGKSYFPFQLYRDEDLTFYKALGNRKLSLSWNPFSLVRGVFQMREVGKRMSAKKLEGNMKGEGLVKGGVILFDKMGQQKYAYREELMNDIPVDDILAAVKAIKAEQ